MRFASFVLTSPTESSSLTLPLVGAVTTVVSMLTGLWGRDYLARKRRAEDAESAERISEREILARMQASRDDYRDKYMEERIRSASLEAEIRGLRERVTYLTSVLPEHLT